MPWPSKKLMLTIGVGDYDSQPKLRQPPFEVQEIYRALFGLGLRGNLLSTGFGGEKLSPEAACTTANMRARVDELLLKTVGEPGALAFFYYSGHGLLYEHKHYLLPKDYTAVPLGFCPKMGGALCVEDDLIAMIQKADCAAIIMLDCCRNEPDAKKAIAPFQGLYADTKDVSQHQGASIQVIFSCGPGQTATAGGASLMSPFTQAVVKNLPKQGEPFQHIVNTALGAAQAQNGMSQLLSDPGNRLSSLVLLPAVPAPQQPPIAPEDEHWHALEVDPKDVKGAEAMLRQVLTGPDNTPTKLDLKGCTVKVKLSDSEQDLKVTRARVEVHNGRLDMPPGASLIVAADVKLSNVHIKGYSPTPLGVAVTPLVGQEPEFLPSERPWIMKNKDKWLAAQGLVNVIAGGQITLDHCQVSYEPCREHVEAGSMHQHPCHGMVVEAGGVARLEACTLSKAPGCGLLTRHRQDEDRQAVVQAHRTKCELNKGMGFCAYGRGAELTAGEGCKSEDNHETGFVALDGGKLTAAGGCVARGSKDGGGFLAWGPRAHLIAGKACLAEENQRSGFVACDGGRLDADAQCTARRSKQMCGFIAEGNGSNLDAKEGCIADSNRKAGFHAVYGGQLTAGADCCAVNSKEHHGFSSESDGSKLTAGTGCTARANHFSGFVALQGGTLIAKAGCKAEQNKGNGFIAYWVSSMLAADVSCLAAGNDEAGFQASYGGHLTARDKCQAINSGGGYGFLAKGCHEGHEACLEVGEQCEAVANFKSGFAAVGGAKLTMRKDCRAVRSKFAYGFCAEGDGSEVQLGENCVATKNFGDAPKEVDGGIVKPFTPGGGPP